MANVAGDVAVFTEHRRLLLGVAYRMLGSMADAEDVVQEAWLRWSTVDESTPADPKAYLASPGSVGSPSIGYARFRHSASSTAVSGCTNP